MRSSFRRDLPLARLLGGAAVIALLATPFAAPRSFARCGNSRVDEVRLVVVKFANEAYPQWRRAYAAQCPRSLYELTEFVDATTVDLWGVPYRYECTAKGLLVWSLGEDQLPNTGDDIRSND